MLDSFDVRCLDLRAPTAVDELQPSNGAPAIIGIEYHSSECAVTREARRVLGYPLPLGVEDKGTDFLSKSLLISRHQWRALARKQRVVIWNAPIKDSVEVLD